MTHDRTQDADYVAVRRFLTEAENAQVTDEDIVAAARVFIGQPTPRMVANRIAVLLRFPHSGGAL